jgi:hypothetical protein
MLKLPLFGIFIINLVLLTSYEFLVVLTYIGIILTVVSELLHNKWKLITIGVEIILSLVIIAAFINAYATTKVQPI